jgi:hypothetical protein
MRRVIATFAIVTLAMFACDPLEQTTAVTTPAATVAPSASVAPSPAVIDARIELEEGPDASFGESVTTVRAILAVPALGTRRQVFAVPYPYRCTRKDDRDLVIECVGGEGTAWVKLHADEHHVVATARDYGRLDRDAITIDLAVPRGAAANVYAPARLPSSYERPREN